MRFLAIPAAPFLSNATLSLNERYLVFLNEGSSLRFTRNAIGKSAKVTGEPATVLGQLS